MGDGTYVSLAPFLKGKKGLMEAKTHTHTVKSKAAVACGLVSKAKS